ncbi:MAG: CDP-alcohol phosphatidyltransferase family protein [Sedimentisphaerales bacterium]|nr:CDP-alcohol phosphatidyltransferase family protein [Sedimentisphaerales bacterium]
MKKTNFSGDKKAPMKTLLAGYERRLIDSNVSKFPTWIQGYHLTLMTILWSAGLVIFGYLAQNNLHWLWLSSVMLFLQWFTDCFDGALGRHRDTGIPKWGFFMDHLLDFVFMACVFVGYSFLLTGINKDIVLLLIPVFGTFMVSSFLSFGATGEFKITYLATGPTEIRIWFIVLNTLLIFFGTAWIEKILVYILIISIVFLCIVIFRTQKHIWKIDMQDKANRTG